MSIAQQNLVDELSAGDVSLPKLGKLAAASFVVMERLTDTAKDHREILDKQTNVQHEQSAMLAALKKQITEEIHPAIQEFRSDKKRGLSYIKFCLPGIAAALVAIGGWAWAQGPDALNHLAFLNKLSEEKIIDTATKAAGDLDKGLEGKLTARITEVRFEIKEDTSKAIREHQLWEDTHRK